MINEELSTSAHCHYIQLFRERLSEKSTQLHSSRPKDSMDRSIEQLHVLNTYEISRHVKRELSRFLSLQTCGNKVLLATLNFRRIFLTQRHVTVKVKLQIRAS